MTREEIDAYIKENTVDHFNALNSGRYPDDWGSGQHKMDIIRKIVKVGHETGEDFFFAKKVTAMDDELLEIQTTEAGEGWLFAFHRELRELNDFWEKVEKATI